MTPRERRKQAERSSDMRRALLDAAFDALVESGFRGTTTTEVTRRAGVSPGALLHHFPTKAELLTAAVEHAFGRRIAEYQALVSSLEPSADRVEVAIDLLWSMYSRPAFLAWNELWTAARTDTELAAVMTTMDEQFLAASTEVFRGLFPAAPPAALHLMYALMSGLAINDSLPEHQPADPESVLALFKTAIREVLGEPPAPPTTRRN